MKSISWNWKRNWFRKIALQRSYALVIAIAYAGKDRVNPGTGQSILSAGYQMVSIRIAITVGRNAVPFRL